MVPYLEQGRPTGLKLLNVERSPLLGQLGFENGDILHAINGADLSTPDSALSAYVTLREANHLAVTLSRRGTRMTVSYAIE